jgi:hypothetical protein
MAAIGAPPDNPSVQAPDLRLSPDGQRSRVLIMGARRGDPFVEVLISADSLSDEAVIRSWLAQHGIPVAPPCRNPAGHPQERYGHARVIPAVGADRRRSWNSAPGDSHARTKA